VVADDNTLLYLGYPALQDPTLLAEDGYHPSASGYRAMALALAEQLNSQQGA
jgi:lysophospholipase L1-like esterase